MFSDFFDFCRYDLSHAYHPRHDVPENCHFIRIFTKLFKRVLLTRNSLLTFTLYLLYAYMFGIPLFRSMFKSLHNVRKMMHAVRGAIKKFRDFSRRNIYI